MTTLDDASALAPVLPPAAPADETPPRVWRVVPEQARRWAPGWVIGKLVHAALAAWRFPGDDHFGDWLRAQAQSHGLHDTAQLDDAVRRAQRLLGSFRRHPLYAEIAGAEVRRHEVPYTLAEDSADDALAVGQIDLLFRTRGRWTLVDFKTERLRDERAREEALADDGAYRAQIERYLAAVTALLGERPRGLLCLLDDRGACSVVEIGAGPVAAPTASPDDAWAQVYELADPTCAPLLVACRARARRCHRGIGLAGRPRGGVPAGTSVGAAAGRAGRLANSALGGKQRGNSDAMANKVGAAYSCKLHAINGRLLL